MASGALPGAEVEPASTEPQRPASPPQPLVSFWWKFLFLKVGRQQKGFANPARPAHTVAGGASQARAGLGSGLVGGGGSGQDCQAAAAPLLTAGSAGSTGESPPTLAGLYTQTQEVRRLPTRSPEAPGLPCTHGEHFLPSRPPGADVEAPRAGGGARIPRRPGRSDQPPDLAGLGLRSGNTLH